MALILQNTLKTRNLNDEECECSWGQPEIFMKTHAFIHLPELTRSWPLEPAVPQMSRVGSPISGRAQIFLVPYVTMLPFLWLLWFVGCGWEFVDESKGTWVLLGSCSPCSPSSTDKIYVLKFVLHQWIYDETKFRLRITCFPMQIWLLLSACLMIS